MKKKTTVVILIAITILFVLFFKTPLNNFLHSKTHSQALKSNKVSKDVNNKQIDYFTLFYALKSQKLIDQSININHIAYKVKEEPLLLKDKTLVDVYFYVKTMNLLEKQVYSKREIIKYVNSLQTEDGSFSIDPNTIGESDLKTSILPTKMAIEIYEYLNAEIPNNKKLNTWLTRSAKSLENFDESNYVSYGSYLYMLKEISNKLNLSGSEELNSYLEASLSNLQPLFLTNKTKITVEEIYTATQINLFFKNKQISMDKRFIESFMESIQLKDGSFPLYGIKGRSPDITTTYLAVSSTKHLKVSIARQYQLKHYLQKELQESL